MEFEGQYLTYEEYKALGGDLDLLPFNLLEFEARRKIDIRTQNRLIGVEEIPQAVKACVYKMVNQMSNYDKSMSNISQSTIASENIDGYSASYITNDKIKDVINSKNNVLEDIMEEYLIGVCANGKHIMFLGVD